MTVGTRFAPLFFILTLLGACQASHSALEPKPQEVSGMQNAALTGDLLIGGQPTEEALEYLAREGYRDVVSVRSEGEIDWDEESRVEALGMSFHRIEMSNPVNEITDDEVAAFAQFMDERDGPVLLHCGSGNRAAGLWAVWLIEHEEIDPADAIRLATSAGMRESMKAVVERRVSKNAKR